jgi:DNA polymerase-1
MSDKKLFLLDGHALVYRAHYAFIARPLINSKGWNVSAVNGFLRTLWELLRKEKPSHIAVSFDLPSPTFRHKMYEPYKANRDSQPEDITFALPYIFRLLEAFRIPIVTMDGFEADDVIGTLAKQAEAEGYKVFMMTPDKDYGQLVSENIFMYKPARQGNDVEIWGIKEVLENWQIERVDQVVDMLGLQGDSVDNIPGIPGIGPKTAAILLQKYGSVENIIANVHELKGKQQESVTNFAEQGLLSKELARIDLNVPIQFDATAYEIEPFDNDKLSELFKELEFRTLADTILGTTAKAAPAANPATSKSTQGSLFDQDGVALTTEADAFAPAAHSVADKNIHNTPHEYHLAETPEQRAALIATLLQHNSVCFDTETTDIDANQAALVGMSFSVKAHTGWYVPVPADREEALAIAAEFKPILENEAIEKVGQNIKYDMLIMRWHGVEIKGPIFDTMVAHYVLEPELRHNMNYLSETFLKYEPVSIETLIGKKGKFQGSMRDAPLEAVKEYAAEDADVTWQLKQILHEKLQAENLEKLYRDIELPLVRVITDIEYEGIRVDPDYLKTYSKELAAEVKRLENMIYEQAGFQFNIASPKQVGEALFEKLKIPYRWKKTSKTDQYATDEDKLAELSIHHPVVATILQYRGAAKLLSTYVDALPKMINPRTGRIHSSFNQALAATGRLSSQNPNLQNIPVKTAEGRRVRMAFIPRDEDHILLSADYSQIELRLIAELSQEEAMLSAFQQGLDIHQATAAKVYEVPLDQVTSDQRRNAKTVNFSIIYGAGATNISQQLGIPRAEAKTLIENYFKQYHGLRKYMDDTVEFARKHGYVMTMMGRRRQLRDINSRNSLAQSNAERVAINTPVQGSAADLIKIAMIHIHDELIKGGYKSKMVLQVHDELVFDVYKPELEKIRPMIEDKMKHAIPGLKVPILVGMGVGNNWLEAH